MWAGEMDLRRIDVKQVDFGLYERADGCQDGHCRRRAELRLEAMVLPTQPAELKMNRP
jgi:hypothetical protein